MDSRTKVVTVWLVSAITAPVLHMHKSTILWNNRKFGKEGRVAQLQGPDYDEMHL